MTIEAINPDSTSQDKFSNISNMILELNGKFESGKFDKNELDILFNLLPLYRKFQRNVTVGNSITEYQGWNHVIAETGYSIWKYVPLSGVTFPYKYNSLNQLFFDNKLLVNRGEADSETATSFDKVYVYDGSTYNDKTTDSFVEGADEFSLMDATDEYLYLGLSTTFNAAKFEFHTHSGDYTLVVEYWNGSSWTTMTANDNNLVDDTTDFSSDGRISWTSPNDWSTKSLFSGDTAKYYIRISTSSSITTVSKAYYIIPGNSVIGLLALSNSDIRNGNWKWCTYNDTIYVTIKNAGGSSYEGNLYITSSSTTTQKKNFFVYNHIYLANFEDSSYNQVATKTDDYTVTINDGIILADSSSTSVTITLPTAVGNKGVEIVIKAIDISNIVEVSPQSGESIDDDTSYIFTSKNKFIKVISDGTQWYIIGGDI